MQTHLSWPIAALVLVSLGTTASTPSPAIPAQDKEKTSQGFVLEVGEHKLADIFARAGEFLGRNYLVPRGEMDNPANAIEIQKKLNLDAIGCEEVVSQLAYIRGFVIIPIDPLRGLYDVVSNRGQRVQEIAIGAVQLAPEEILRKTRLKMYVLTSIPLKHIDANRASQQLRPFFSSGGGRNGLSFGTAGNNSSLIVQGYTTQVAAAIRLLREIDTPETPALPQPVHDQLRSLSTLATQQSNALKAMQQRLSILEAQLAAFDPAQKKK